LIYFVISKHRKPGYLEKSAGRAKGRRGAIEIQLGFCGLESKVNWDWENVSILFIHRHAHALFFRHPLCIDLFFVTQDAGDTWKNSAGRVRVGGRYRSTAGQDELDWEGVSILILVHVHFPSAYVIVIYTL
jgi:hypothetical protein